MIIGQRPSVLHFVIADSGVIVELTVCLVPDILSDFHGGSDSPIPKCVLEPIKLQDILDVDV